MTINLEHVLSDTKGRCVNEDLLRDVRSDARPISRLSELSDKGEGRLTFFFSSYYQEEFLRAEPPSILVTTDALLELIQRKRPDIWDRTAVVSSPEPYLGFARLTQRWARARSAELESSEHEKLSHPTAVIASSAKLGQGVRLGPFVTVGENARIGDRVKVHAGVRIGSQVEIGDDSEIFENVVLYPGVRLGRRVRVHAQSVIGADGFGYAQEKRNGEAVRHVKIEHFGTVVVEDDVEIGALTSIDRATLGATRIGAGSKIDNNVQIGHNVEVDEGAILCGGVGVAGGAKIGAFAIVMGLAGVNNRVSVGDQAEVGPMTAVSKDLKAGESYVGNPVRTKKEYLRFNAALNRWFKRGDR